MTDPNQSADNAARTAIPLATIRYSWGLADSLLAHVRTRPAVWLVCVLISAFYGLLFGGDLVSRVILFAMLVLVFAGLITMQLRKQVAMVGGDLTVIFSEDLFIQQFRDTTVALGWARFKWAKAGRAYWTVCLDPKGRFVIPSSAVSDADATVIRDLLTRKGLLR